MVGKKRWLFFKKLRKESSPSPSPSPSRSPSWRWKLFRSAFKWRRLNLGLSFVDDVIFKIVSVFEAIVLVITLSLFYLCCGCNF